MVTRRDFIKMAGAGAGALAVSAADPFNNFKAGAQNPQRRAMPEPKTPAGWQKINIALVGIGGRGQQDAQEIYQTGMCNVVALCDVNIGSRATQWALNRFPEAKKYQDFRKMFDEMHGQIEAVLIATPDFSHFPIAMRAIKEGIHVYCEKPMCRTFHENQLLIDAALKNPQICTQMGNQGHSGENYFQFKALVESGVLKNVNHITAHMNSSRRWHGYDVNIKKFPSGDPIPETMDWDVWQMQTAFHEYSTQLDGGNWRSWYDFGMGALGDWGAHIFDPCHEFLDLGLPYEVGMLKAEGHNDFFFPMESTINFKFPRRGDKPACTLTWYDGIKNIPELPAGFGESKVSDVPLVAGQDYVPIAVNPGKEIYTDDLIFKGGSHSATLEVIPKEKNDAMAAQGLLPELPEYHFNHYKNWLNAIRGLEKTHSPFEKAGVMCQVMNLGVIAQRLNTTFKFDKASGEIIDNPFANALLTGVPPRKGWEEYYTL